MFTTALLFADGLADGFRKFSRGSSSASDYLLFLLVIGLLAAAAVWLFFTDRRREQTVRDESTPESLFRELCHEHQLSPDERELLLKTIGTGADRLEQPALVFVDPSLLEGRIARSGESAGLRGLMQKLFSR